MLTYQIRSRIFRHKPGEVLKCPAPCEIVLHFQPGQPFGTTPKGGRTAVRAVPATMLFNANSGEHTVESKNPLTPLDVTIEEPSRTARLLGNILTISMHIGSLRELEETIYSLYFALPALLNVPFADPPWIERVEGTLGGVGFRWELDDWRMELRTTTQEDQEKGFVKVWERVGLLSEPKRRRLIAGLHYFQVACRLAREGCVAGEFVAEVILNLAKVLEVLFPPSRDAARKALRDLGFKDAQIECDFIPAMALRNEIDVGHVELGLFTMSQLKTIHAFTDRAEGAFRDMFDRLLSFIESEKFEVEPYELGPARSEAVQLVNRLKECLGKG